MYRSSQKRFKKIVTVNVSFSVKRSEKELETLDGYKVASPQDELVTNNRS